MEQREKLTTRILRNVSWNFLAQALILLASLWAIPFMIHALTIPLYAIYALTSVVVGYFSFLELGFGAAGVKYMAQYMAEKKEGRARDVFWMCAAVYAGMGLLGAVLIAASADVLARRFFKIPPEALGTAVAALRLAGVGFFVAMMSGMASAALRAQNRFDILNKVYAALALCQIGVSVLLLARGFSLVAVLVAGIAVQAAGVLVYVFLAFRSLPFLAVPSWKPELFGMLFRFGGYVTLSGVVAPVLLNIEKLLLTGLRPVALLTYYAVPFSLMERLMVIRSSVTSVLFPTFSAMSASPEERLPRDLHERSIAYIFFAMAFFVLFFIFFGYDFLKIWLGEKMAMESSKILAILMAAGLTNALAAPAVVALQGMGRPQWPAFFHAIEAVFYVPLAFVCIRRWGGAGAALAYFLRTTMDMFLVHVCACRFFGQTCFPWYGRLARRVIAPFTAALAGLFLIKIFGWVLWEPRGYMGIAAVFCVYAALTWRVGLDAFARERIMSFIRER